MGGRGVFQSRRLLLVKLVTAVTFTSVAKAVKVSFQVTPNPQYCAPSRTKARYSEILLGTKKMPKCSKSASKGHHGGGKTKVAGPWGNTRAPSGVSYTPGLAQGLLFESQGFESGAQDL